MRHISVVEVPFWPRHILESFRRILKLEEQRSRQLRLLQGPEPVTPLRDMDAREFVYDARRPWYLLDQGIEDQYWVRLLVFVTHLTNGKFPMSPIFIHYRNAKSVHPEAHLLLLLLLLLHSDQLNAARLPRSARRKVLLGKQPSTSLGYGIAGSKGVNFLSGSHHFPAHRPI